MTSPPSSPATIAKHQHQHQQRAQQRRPKILLWGDSLTQLGFEGWASTLANVYQRRADVINRGLSGYNTSWYLQYLRSCPDDAMLSSLHDNNNNNSNENGAVMLIIIWFGANDASLPDLNPRQYVSIDEYQQNLKTMIQLAKDQHPQAKILLVTPPPVVHEQRLQYQIQRYGAEAATGQLERTLENSGRYAQAAIQVATDCGLPCLDLWKEMQEDESLPPPPATTTIGDVGSTNNASVALTNSTAAPHWYRYFCDGLHFSKEGQDFVGKALLQSIQTSFPSVAVTADPLTGQWANVSSQSGTDLPNIGPPFHEEIDHSHVQAAFDKYYPSTTTTTTTTTTTVAADDVDNNNNKRKRSDDEK